MTNFSLWHLIIIGAICYIAYMVLKWLRRLLKRDRTHPSLHRAQVIVNGYGKVVEQHSSAGGTILIDEGKLPFTKVEIKAAILRLLRASNDSKQRDVLETGYLTLADFQPLAGPTAVEADVGKTDAANMKL